MEIVENEGETPMATMSLLDTVIRDGVQYCSFPQVLNVYFPQVPRATVKRWLLQLGRQQTKTNSIERGYFKTRGLISCRYIISEHDVRALAEHWKTRRNISQRVRNTSDRNTSDPLTTDNNSTEAIVQVGGDNICSSSANEEIEMQASLPIHSPPSANNSEGNAVVESGGEQVSDDISVFREDSSESTVTTSTLQKFGKVGRLPGEAMNSDLKLSLKNLEEFYSETVHPLRHVHKFSASTLNKFVERVSCFLNFCRLKQPDVPLDLNAVDNSELVQSYINYQLKERSLIVSTVVRTLTALMNLARYIHRNSENVEKCTSLVSMGNIQRHLSREERSYRLAVRAGLSGKNHGDLLYSDILATVRQLREQVATTSDAPKHSRILHDFVMLSLYVTCMCGRSKELRTMQLFVESEEGRRFCFDWKVKNNVLVVSATDGKFTLYENDFKTLSTHGPSKLDIDDSMWLIPFLKSYLTERGNLLRGKCHPFMFVNANGNPFTCPSLSNYLATIFERAVNVRAGTTKLRHALVTHVLSLPESESTKLRESLAVLMRHSLKHQKYTYCDISRQEQTTMSRELLNRNIEEAASLDTSTSRIQRKPRNDEPCSSKEVVDSPKCTVEVGDLCALLDPACTCAKDATIFVGKVVKFSVDASEVLLMELRNISDSEPLYRAIVDSSWWESIDSLIFPIDVVFFRGKNLYELRSTAEDVYNVVHS